MPSNSMSWLERVSKDKHSSLFGLIVSNEVKNFHNIDTRIVIEKLVVQFVNLVELPYRLLAQSETDKNALN